MQCLKNWVTKFQFPSGSMRNYTYVELALIWLSSICLGIIGAYGKEYYVSDPLRCIALLCASYILIQLGRAICKYRDVSILSIVCLLCTAASMGFLGYYQTEQSIWQYHAQSNFYINENGTYYVVTTKDSEIIKDKDRTFLKTEGMLYGLIPSKNNVYGQFLEARGCLEMYVEPKSEKTIPAGVILAVTGTPKSLTVIEERGRIDMRGRYMASKLTGRIYEGQYHIITNDELKRIGYHENWYGKLKRYMLYHLGHMRQSIYTIIENNLPGPIAIVSEALLLGGHYSEIDQRIMKGFSYTGLIHILSVSGSHIGLLFSLMYGIAHMLAVRKQQAVYGAMIVVIMYCLIVGCNAPIVRATIMGIIMAFGLIQGRLYHARQALTITAIGILAFDPLTLTDVSFQLSFCATYGVLLFGKPLYVLMEYWPIWVKAPLVLCVSAQLIILPFQLYYFHFISLLSLVAAIVVAPLLDMAIVLLMILLLLYPIISLDIGWFILEYILRISLYLNESLLTIPGGYWWVGYMPLWVCGLYFIILRLLYYIMVEIRVQQRNTVYIMLGLLIGVVGISYGTHRFHRDTIIHTIPISQGVALFIMPKYTFENHDNHVHSIEGLDTSKHLAFKNEDRRIDSHIPMLVMDIPKEKMSHSAMYQLENAIHTYGYTLEEVRKVSFSSKSDFQILYQNEKSLYILCNGQTKKKILKLLDGYMVYIMTTHVSLLHDLVQLDEPNLKGIVYYAPFQNLGDIEPDDELIHAVRFEYVEDILL